MNILYGAPLSPFVRKVAIFLEEKNIPYEWKMVKPHSEEPAFKAISPLGKIPAFQDEALGIADSSVICAYLEKKYPTPALYPADAANYAKALWLEEYFDSAMIKPMRAIYREGFSNPKFFGKASDAEQHRLAEEEVLPMFAYLESVLKPGEWVVNDTFSIADITLAGSFANTMLAGYELDGARFPKLKALAERAQLRPSFAAVAKKMDEFIRSL